METIARNVRDLKSDERQAYERLLGHALRENQQIIIKVVTLDQQPDEHRAESVARQLPDWCNVYDGLSDEEIAEVEEVILRGADLSRNGAGSS